MKSNSLILLLLLISLCQCSNPITEETNTEEDTSSSVSLKETAIAKNFCACAQTLIELNKKMEKLHAEGKNDEFIEMSSQLGKEFKATVTCSKESLGTQKIAEDQKNSIANALIVACPEIPERMVDQLTTQTMK